MTDLEVNVPETVTVESVVESDAVAAEVESRVEEENQPADNDQHSNNPEENNEENNASWNNEENNEQEDDTDAWGNSWNKESSWEPREEHVWDKEFAVLDKFADTTAWCHDKQKTVKTGEKITPEFLAEVQEGFEEIKAAILEEHQKMATRVDSIKAVNEEAGEIYKQFLAKQMTMHKDLSADWHAQRVAAGLAYESDKIRPPARPQNEAFENAVHKGFAVNNEDHVCFQGDMKEGGQEKKGW